VQEGVDYTEPTCQTLCFFSFASTSASSTLMRRKSACSVESDRGSITSSPQVVTAATGRSRLIMGVHARERELNWRDVPLRASGE
jgi:hypothetical protein